VGFFVFILLVPAKGFHGIGCCVTHFGIRAVIFRLTARFLHIHVVGSSCYIG